MTRARASSGPKTAIVAASLVAALALGGLAILRSPGRPAAAQDAPFREFPIGDPVKKNAMRVTAVWLPPVTMDHGEPLTGENVIHLECDVAGDRKNPNGFGLGEWIPYLTVKYTITPAGGGEPLSGTFHPMVAKDGPHYGASIRMPGKGRYRLRYELRPPSENGFGRHTDPVTGVDPWWEPFTVEWDWNFPGAK